MEWSPDVPKELERTLKGLLTKFRSVPLLTHQERLTVFHGLVAYLYFFAADPLVPKSVLSMTLHSAAQVIIDFQENPVMEKYRLNVEPFASQFLFPYLLSYLFLSIPKS